MLIAKDEPVWIVIHGFLIKELSKLFINKNGWYNYSVIKFTYIFDKYDYYRWISLIRKDDAVTHRRKIYVSKR